LKENPYGVIVPRLVDWLLRENPYGVIVPCFVDWLLRENPYGVYPVRDYLSIKNA
jgi:hypothetical protein